MPKKRHPVDAILRPRSVAVIGASRHKGSIGWALVNNMINCEYKGIIFPVNSNARVIQSMKCYPDVTQIPDEVDLAVIVVPREHVLKVIRDCGRKGVKGIVVITAGFKEIGGDGIALENELKKRIDKYNMRMVGPNCMGVLNTESDVSLNATFGSSFPPTGNVGFMSQSGALGEVILSMACEVNLGISMFVSMGNKTDISGNDLLEYWEKDPSVKVILMYLESFGNPRRFTTVARRITPKKPIIIIKAGKTPAGARAVSSHTGAVVGGETAVESFLEQCGVIRVPTMDEMFAIASAFSTQPLPKGNRIAIVTNAGGPGILATDACVSLGLNLSDFSPKTIKRLKKLLPVEASVQNPIDMIASASAQNYDAILRLVADDPGVDGIIAIFVSPIMIDAHEIARSIVRASKGIKKPLLTCFMGKENSEEGVKELRRNKLPVYIFPEEAARAMAAMCKYREIREKPRGKQANYKVNTAKARSIIKKVQREKRRDLSLLECQALLECYGIPFAPSKIVATPAEAIAQSLQYGYPVVLKAISERLSHKSDVGGVRLDLRNGDEVGLAFMEMKETLGVTVKDMKIMAQKMMTSGKEVIIGMSNDPKFGPLIMFGLGGIYVEIMKDVAFKIHPITKTDAQEMIESIKGFPLLRGARGEKPVNIDLIAEMLLRVSQLAGDIHEIDEMDLNPLMVTEERSECCVVDVRIRIK
ncbi:acetate--CoA ligase family protein [Acidobacteriota bacterium]